MGRLIVLVGGEIISPFIIVLSLYVLQKKFPKTRTLYICSKISFIFLFGITVINLFFNFFFRSEFLLDLIAKIYMAGTMLAMKIVESGSGMDDIYLRFVVLSAIFSEIFYTIILFPIILVVSYVRKEYFPHKTDEMKVIQ